MASELDGVMGDDSGASVEERLYDEYLDTMLEGEPEDPASFCSRHGVKSGDLEARLGELFRMAAARRASMPDTRTVLVGPTAPMAARRAAPGERLGDNMLLDVLGGGGMGVVYRAHQESLRRDVALKVMSANLQTSASALERFEREARALARLQHPSIVRVHENGECDGVHYLVMELVRGEDMDSLLRHAQEQGELLPASRVVKWFARLARALECAHQEGIIHRDVKPSNVLIKADDTPVLIDFGLARDQEATAITRTEMFMGSPAYAAPEQILAQRGAMDERTDIYSLGASLYECLCGRPPFAGDTIEQVFHQAILDEPVPLRELDRSISRDLETVTLKALEKDPKNRYQSATALAEDLEAILEFRPIAARPPGIVRRLGSWGRRRPGLVGAALTAVVAVIVLLVLVAWDQHAEVTQRRREAALLMDGAHKQLEQMSVDRQQSRELEHKLRRLELAMQQQYVPPADYDRLQRDGDRAERLARDRVESYYRIQELVRRAQRLDPDLEAVDALLARLHVEKFDEARATGDAVAMESHKEAALTLDPEGPHAVHLFGMGTVDIVTHPPGATAHIFAMREQATIVPGGEERIVPVPWLDGAITAEGLPVIPGTWMLDVRAPAGDLRRGDLIVDVAGLPIEGVVYVIQDGIHGVTGDRVLEANGQVVRSPFDSRTAGGITSQARAQEHDPYPYVVERDGQRIEVDILNPASLEVGTAADLLRYQSSRGRVYRDGELVELDLPAGLDSRITTTAPLLRSSAAAGTTPVRGARTPPGDLLVVLELEGHETQVVPMFVSWGGSSSVEIPLLPAGTSPPGFVPVFIAREPVHQFWLAELEVTMGEWLAFLADPEVQARIDSASGAILVPRSGPNRKDWLIDRKADGAFALPHPFDPAWPVLGISWDDAQAYAEWRTRLARAAGQPYRFALPTIREWRRAAASGGRRRYVYGNRFRPRWTKCCFSRPFADPEPVASFPVDETVYGVRDVGGSAWEWVDGWWEERKGLRRMMGGAWGQGSPENLAIEGGFGMPSTRTTGETGMRLALHFDW